MDQTSPTKNSNLIELIQQALTQYFLPLANYQRNIDGAPLWQYRQYVLQQADILAKLRQYSNSPSFEGNVGEEWRFITEHVLLTCYDVTTKPSAPVGFSQLTPDTQKALLTYAGFRPDNHLAAGAVSPREKVCDCARSLLMTYLMCDNELFRRRAALALMTGKNSREKYIIKTNDNSKFSLVIETYEDLLGLNQPYIELAHSNFSELDISGLNFSNQNLPYSHIDSTTTIQGTRFQFCCFNNANLNLNCNDVNFASASFVKAYLDMARCRNIQFDYANFSYAHFKALRGSELCFQHAYFYQTRFVKIVLKIVDFREADFSHVVLMDEVKSDIEISNARFSSELITKQYYFERYRFADGKLENAYTFDEFLQMYSIKPEISTQTALSANSAIVTAIEAQRDIIKESSVTSREQPLPFVQHCNPKPSSQPWRLSTIDESKNVKIAALDETSSVYSALSYFVHQSSESKACYSGFSATRLLHALGNSQDNIDFLHAIWREFKSRPGHDNYPGRIRIEGIDKINNPFLWKCYCHQKQLIKETLERNKEEDPLMHIGWHMGNGSHQLPVLDKAVGECWLFHATSSVTVMRSVMEKGFDTHYYSGHGKLGKGIYLTDAFGRSSTYSTWSVNDKAKQQSKQSEAVDEGQPIKAMFIVRAVLGRTFTQHKLRDKKAQTLPEGYTAIWAPDGTLRKVDNDFHCNEFLVNTISGERYEYDPRKEPVDQLYPEWCIYYTEHAYPEATKKAKLDTASSEVKQATAFSQVLVEAYEQLYDYLRLLEYATPLERVWAKERLSMAFARCRNQRAHGRGNEEKAYNKLKTKCEEILGRESSHLSNCALLSKLHSVVTLLSLVKLKETQQKQRESIKFTIIDRFDRFRPHCVEIESAAKIPDKVDEISKMCCWLAWIYLEVGELKYQRQDVVGWLEHVHYACLVASNDYVKCQLTTAVDTGSEGSGLQGKEKEKEKEEEEDDSDKSIDSYTATHGHSASAPVSEQALSSDNSMLILYIDKSMLYLKDHYQQAEQHAHWCKTIAEWKVELLLQAWETSKSLALIDDLYQDEWHDVIKYFQDEDRQIFVNCLIQRIDRRLRDSKQSSTNEALKKIRLMAKQLPNEKGDCQMVVEQQAEWQRLLVNGITHRIDQPLPAGVARQNLPKMRLDWLTHEGAIGQGLLEPMIIEQLFFPEIEKASEKKIDKFKSIRLTDKVKGAVTHGRRLVIGLNFNVDNQSKNYFAYLKFFSEFPGIQLAADVFLQKVTSYSAMGTLCKLSLLDKADKIIDDCPVYISKGAGDILQNLDADSWQETEDKLDSYCFTLTMIATLLLGLEDNKKDNICRQKFESHYRLVNIDADRIFIDDFDSDGYVNVKSAVFCFAKMREPFDQRAIDRFLQLSPTATLRDWLHLLKEYQKSIDILFSKERQKKLEHGERNLGKISDYFSSKKPKEKMNQLYSFVNIAFSPEAMHRLVQRWRRMRCWLLSDDNRDRTHQDLFEAVATRLALRYADYQLLSAGKTPAQRFDAFCESHTRYDYKKFKETETARHHQSTLYPNLYIKTALLTERDKQALYSLSIVRQKTGMSNLNQLQAIECGQYNFPNTALAFINQAFSYFQYKDGLMALWESGQRDKFVDALRDISYANVVQGVLSRIDVKGLSLVSQKALLIELVNVQFETLKLRGFTLDSNTLPIILKLISNQRKLYEVLLIDNYVSLSKESQSKFKDFISIVLSGKVMLKLTVENLSATQALTEQLSLSPSASSFIHSKRLTKKLSRRSRKLSPSDVAELPAAGGEQHLQAKKWWKLFSVNSNLTALVIDNSQLVAALFDFDEGGTAQRFPQLKKLELSHSGCHTINLRAPNLIDANFANNSYLTDLIIGSTVLKRLNVSNCPNLTQSALHITLLPCERTLELIGFKDAIASASSSSFLSIMPHAEGKIVKQIDFSQVTVMDTNRPDIEKQHWLIEGILSTKIASKQLQIMHCAALEDKHVKRLLEQSLELEELMLEDCPNISEKTLEYIEDYTRQAIQDKPSQAVLSTLLMLALTRLPKLKTIGNLQKPFILNSVVRMDISDNPELNCVSFQGGELVWLSVKDNPSLRVLQLDAVNLRKLTVTNSQQLNEWKISTVCALDLEVENCHYLEKSQTDNEAELLEAVRWGKPEKIFRLLSQGASLKTRDQDGNTALLMAAWNGHIQILRHLLLSEYTDKVSLADRNGGGLTALLMAACNGHIEILQHLLSEKYADKVSLLDRDNDGNTALLLATIYGRTETVEYLLVKHGKEVDLRAKNHKGNTVLMLAMLYNRKKVIDYLLENHLYEVKLDEVELEMAIGREPALARVREKNNLALMKAVEENSKEKIKKLLYQGASLKTRDCYGNTALLLAAFHGHKQILEDLLNKHADKVNLLDRSNDGDTVLLMTVYNGRVKILHYLLSNHGYKLNLKAKNHKGNTVLMVAMLRDRKNIIDYLLKHYPEKVKLEETDIEMATREQPALASIRERNNAALMEAVKENNKEKLVKLLYQGASLKTRDRYGNTALLLAARRGYMEILQCLLSDEHESKVSLTDRDSDGNTALLLAAGNGWTGGLRYLLSTHADKVSLSDKNNDGNTALLLAAMKGQVGVLEYLLNRRADKVSLLDRDSAGNTALLLAAIHGQIETVKYILSKHGKEVDLKAKDHKGNTVLMVAMLYNRTKVIDYLLAHHADQVKLDEIDLEMTIREQPMLARIRAKNNLALIEAVKRDNKEEVTKLLYQGASLIYVSEGLSELSKDSIRSKEQKSSLATQLAFFKQPSNKKGSKNLDHDYLYKVSIMGDFHVGKTCLLSRFAHNFYEADPYLPKVCLLFNLASFKVKLVNINDKHIKLHIWNIKDQSMFEDLRTTEPKYEVYDARCRGSHAIIIGFDITDRKSFSNIDEWLYKADKCASIETILFIVGTKCDLDAERQVTYQEAKAFADERGLGYIETSAKMGTNVDELFFEVTKLIYHQLHQEEESTQQSSAYTP